MTGTEDVIPVAADDPLVNRAGLEPFLRDALGLGGAEIRIDRFRGGNANISFLVRSGAQEFVLRRPPAGPLPPKAHDMLREFRVLEIVHPRFDLAPKPFVSCDDRAVLDAPFFVMEHRRGVVIRSDERELLADPGLNRRIGFMLPAVLARFHAIDSTPLEQARMGRPERFAARQVESWTARSRAAVPEPDLKLELEKIAAWLAERVPQPAATGVLHNDFKLDNIVVSEVDLAEPAALLDWDMCTVADQLFDLGLLLSYWVHDDDPQEWRLGASMPTFMPGFPRRQDVVETYAKLRGADTSQIQWYVVFANFRIIVALQQIFRRYRTGQNSDPRFAVFGERIAIMTGKTLGMIGRDTPWQPGILD